MPKMLDKICQICEDKASGFNFNAITCESCKAFFRRNATKENQFHCFLGGKCRINLMYRKYCKMCRLKKCFAMGMKKDLILSEEEKQFRQNRLKEKKKLKQQIIDELTKIADTSTVDVVINSTSPSLVTHNVNDLLDSMDSNNYDKNDNKQESKVNNPDSDNQISIDINQKSFELSMIPISRQTISVETFNEQEGNRLTELFSAIKTLNNRSPKHSIVINPDLNEALRVIYKKFETDIKKIVKFSKGLFAFNGLCDDDQICLIKYSIIEIVNLRILLHFNPNHRIWNILTDSDTSDLLFIDILKEGKRNYYQNFCDFIDKISAEWHSDKSIIDLLTAIILFDPNRPDLKHSESIKLQQQVYIYLLQRYLGIQFGSDCLAKTTFLRLLNSLNDLHIINNKIALNWSERTPIVPILKEIADRKYSITEFY
ncbi:nuclear hormone receptor HR96-like [Oppia nitens]|uniref:nuclear hormone receptor HR96-like n=1 Tax=Oppia nitens TaxID=1686743 RepID=UPI0023DACC71|nr:nuclear hormone receptor HR96-like [Oppia nitens]